jgi:hypothetical protein
MVSNIYLLLGLQQDTPWSEVAQRYSLMLDSLNSQTADEDVNQKLKMAEEKLSQSFEHNKYQNTQGPVQTTSINLNRPKIGQLLVASGLLTLEELDAALEIQFHTKHEHIPIGQILLAAGYITEQQLDYYLRQQELFTLPPDHPERWGQRLVELGWVSKDQLKVALIEQKTTGCSLRQALINRGWLTTEQLDRIF